MLEALFVLEIFIFFSWSFGYIDKLLDKKANFKTHDVADYNMCIYDTHIIQYLKK